MFKVIPIIYTVIFIYNSCKLNKYNVILIDNTVLKKNIKWNKLLEIQKCI